MTRLLSFVLVSLLACLPSNAESESGLTRDEALKMARTIGGRELGSFWFEHGDKEGPYHHSGRVVLERRDHISYQVADKDEIGHQTGLYVDDETWETHLDFFTSASGQGWVVCHNFKPEVGPTHPKPAKDNRSKVQKALGPAAAYAIENGDLDLLKRLLSEGLNLNEYLEFEDKTTALYLALWERELDIAKFLLKEGADPNMRSRWGERPVDLAIARKMDGFLEALALPDNEGKLVVGIPEGVLHLIFKRHQTEEVHFIEWQEKDPPVELLKWLEKKLPNARPASRMETLERRPLGAHSWYRDKEDGQYGSLLQIKLKPIKNEWQVQFRDSAGPIMAGHGWRSTFHKDSDYWHEKEATSWDE